ncbi:RNA polymerase sigma factor [Actinoallomurus vinaceus]|uniref:RNA polymerase sigma factor n=1 Tax=Actinoallomurus vinaceus TaxID=1080074 RepID=UPI003CD093C2
MACAGCSGLRTRSGPPPRARGAQGPPPRARGARSVWRSPLSASRTCWTRGPPGHAAPEGRAAVILSRLPPRYRTVLELRFLQGCTLRQAAAALGTSIGNAKVLQHRALRLAAKLGTGDPAADFTVPEGRRPGPE